VEAVTSAAGGGSDLDSSVTVLEMPGENSGNGMVTINQVTTPVPEPGSLSLLALSLCWPSPSFEVLRGGAKGAPPVARVGLHRLAGQLQDQIGEYATFG
jgi:hypothetical protein